MEHCFYLMEGSFGRQRYKPTEEQQKKLKVCVHGLSMKYMYITVAMKVHEAILHRRYNFGFAIRDSGVP